MPIAERDLPKSEVVPLTGECVETTPEEPAPPRRTPPPAVARVIVLALCVAAFGLSVAILVMSCVALGFIPIYMRDHPEEGSNLYGLIAFLYAPYVLESVLACVFLSFLAVKVCVSPYNFFTGSVCKRVLWCLGIVLFTGTSVAATILFALVDAYKFKPPMYVPLVRTIVLFLLLIAAVVLAVRGAAWR